MLVAPAEPRCGPTSAEPRAVDKSGVSVTRIRYGAVLFCGVMSALACLFFGAATALQFQLPAMGVNVPNALLIMLPYLMALLAAGGLVGRQTAPPYLTRAYVR